MGLQRIMVHTTHGWHSTTRMHYILCVHLVRLDTSDQVLVISTENALHNPGCHVVVCVAHGGHSAGGCAAHGTDTIIST